MRFNLTKRTMIALGGAAVLVTVGAGAAIAITDDAGSQKPITGPALDHATRVALAETGGGRVSETEVNDEEGYYQVEVTLDNGQQTDVNLDRNFNVVKTKTEGSDGGS